MIEQKGEFTEHFINRLEHELLSHLPQNASTTRMLINSQAIINTFVAHVIMRIEEYLQLETTRS